jgi:antirestriction protein ArdC
MDGNDGYAPAPGTAWAAYSLHNQLLIAHQRPDATYVCGFRAWIELGYCVRKGERAIRILAPQTVRIRTGEAAEDGDGGEETRVFFRTVAVFDRSQVDPLPDRDQVPLEPPSELVDGDSHAHLIPSLECLADQLGYRVRYRSDTGTAGGWCDAERHVIVVTSGAPPNAKVRILVHELAHAVGIDYDDYGRHLAEVLVDAATFVVCAGVGLDVSGESVP